MDPVKLTFDSIIYYGNLSNESLEAALMDEIKRQMDKSNTNHIGYFHQNIFSIIGMDQGWKIPHRGFDIENDELSIYVEMKNKHNTMNSSSAAKTYMRMQHKIIVNPNARCFLVEVIAKRSQNIPWICSIDEESLSNEKIRRISIDQFYSIVTGIPDSFARLCLVLPIVIRDVLDNEGRNVIDNTVCSDIREAGIDNIIYSLYMNSFASYLGFGETFNKESFLKGVLVNE